MLAICVGYMWTAGHGLVTPACFLSVFVSAPSPLCEFLGLMSLLCTRILGYSGHAFSLYPHWCVNVNFRESCAPPSLIFFIPFGYQWCSPKCLFDLQRFCFQHISLALLFKVSIFMMNSCCWFYPGHFSIFLTFSSVFLTFSSGSWFEFFCKFVPFFMPTVIVNRQRDIVVENLASQYLCTSSGVKSGFWDETCCLLSCVLSMSSLWHAHVFRHLIWLSEGAVFWLISLPLEAQSPGPLNRRK